MNDFEKQLENDLKKNLVDFNSSAHLNDVRNIYKQNFDLIKAFIARTNPRTAIEDIMNLDASLPSLSTDDFLILKEINRGIIIDSIDVSDIL